mgnify:CR=1 FL=1
MVEKQAIVERMLLERLEQVQRRTDESFLALEKQQRDMYNMLFKEIIDVSERVDELVKRVEEIEQKV